jgi:hypothetical protein
MVGKSWSRACAIAAACIALAGAAHANVTWVVNGTFDDGGTVSGHFTIDTYGYLLNNFNLQTTTGSTLPGFDYTAGDSYYSNGAFYVDAEPAYQADLHLTFADNLNVPVSNNPLVGGSGGPSWECAGSYSCYVPMGPAIRYIASGSATGSVPELSTWGMMALGFAGLGFAGYRKARGGRAAFAT